MAVKTPRHPERLALVGDHLFLNGAVAVIAVDASVNVNAVVEENEIRYAVQPVPFQRLLLYVAGADRL